jgi:hypothetical protein
MSCSWLVAFLQCKRRVAFLGRARGAGGTWESIGPLLFAGCWPLARRWWLLLLRECECLMLMLCGMPLMARHDLLRQLLAGRSFSASSWPWWLGLARGGPG